MTADAVDDAASPWCPRGWTRRTLEAGGSARTYYVVEDGKDAARPTVMLLHEFPGISENLVCYARELALDFRVIVPSIVGRDGSPRLAESLKAICVNHEIRVLCGSGVSRAAAWLKNLADKEVGKDGARYGVIGLCLTGNFALAAATDTRVAAAVVGEPAAPAWPWGLGLSRGDRALLEARVEDPGDALEVRGYRFRADLMSPCAKLGAARDLIGDGRMLVTELPTWDPRRHSTVTGRRRSPRAVQEVRDFLLERLSPPAAPSP
ncbi:dienelactone hydrolase family protein [Demequina iriomotensis]|uniref:dienelactone hydrolase family protein n=1 Tax=Demequina iriomotensis TaxID=1536641 RepID=UPI0007857FD1|nr:dienelactone hydrolase family protein [Demequina iriomotensis]